MTATVFDNSLFRGEVVLVTGAAGGIGAGIAKAFADLGANVIAQDINAEQLAQSAAGFARDGQTITQINGDLSVPGTADRVFDQALEAHGRIDILVNNAGRSWGVATDAITVDRTSELMELNLNSVLWLSKRFIEHAREHGEGGSIVQIASTAGVAGYQRRANVRVNAILPHVVETEMFRTVASPRDKKNWAAEIPMGRFAQVEDVANLAIFLCSPAASYLTGGLYPVDGGAMAGSFGGD